MNASTYLMVANVAVWIAVAGYVARLAVRQRRLERRLKQMEITGAAR